MTAVHAVEIANRQDKTLGGFWDRFQSFED
jgi:hypothetical protein